MKWPDIYLVCLAVGVLWTLATLLLGGLHLGHAGSAHGHGHAGHWGGLHRCGGTKGGSFEHGSVASHLAALINPSGLAVFLAWFGAVGYLLTRHSGLMFWLNLAIAGTMGLTGAWILALFLQFLQSQEKPLDPVDYEMTGTLGKVSSSIRADGVGEVIYIRDGARKCVPARSEDGTVIERGREVIVIRYERGIAYVRTWEAMTQS
jgi:membrane protein implicated in regulation of membrane protease activity